MAYDYQSADPALYGVLKQHAQHNRNNPTEAESLLWCYLQCDGMGVTFKRQHIIGDFIVDFICLPYKLIIEIDGGYHQIPQQQVNDEQRTEWLNEQGYKVIRFSNDEVISGIDKVLERINKALYE